ncbi:MAG: hypothetical protein SFY68_11845, partial [Candidatus Sumerlaeia bacterium]|nr:hypothetical protein [Candidatus Sumerlaeia bacterium]
MLVKSMKTDRVPFVICTGIVLLISGLVIAATNSAGFVGFTATTGGGQGTSSSGFSLAAESPAIGGSSTSPSGFGLQQGGFTPPSPSIPSSVDEWGVLE